MFKTSRPLTAGVKHVFRTNSISGDTVIHIWDPIAGLEVGFDDDGLGLGFNSRAEFTPSITRTYDIIVRAYSSYGYGVTRLRMCTDIPAGDCAEKAPDPEEDPALPENWIDLAIDTPFSGTWLHSVAYDPSLPGYEYQTSEVNQAASGTLDTMLLGMNDFQHLVAFDDDSGVGLMDRLSASSGSTSAIRNLIVAAYTSDGYTNVYSNDRPIRDEDGDGLGKYLEYYLRSCDTQTPGDVMSRSHCYGRNFAQLVDSDRDGLFDSEELFGVDDALYPQRLPAWGSNVLRKDIFIEQDWAIRPTCPAPPPNETDCWHADAAGQNPFTGQMATEIAQAFQSASEWEAGNIEGTGIGVHIDVGPQPPRSECSDYTICGNWGHGGQEKLWSTSEPAWRGWYTPEVRTYTGAPYPAPEEESGHGSRFRYLMIFPQGGSTGRPFDLIPVGINGNQPAPDRNPRSVIHELGHSLGIGHGGGDAVNCKPNYASIMNYAFDKHSFGYSHGLNTSAIDPGHTPETNVLSGDATHLGEASFATKFKFPWADSTGSVDFNRSRVPGIDNGTLGFLRAGVTHAASGGCGAAANVNTPVTWSPEDTAAKVTPALAIYAGRQWVFWAEGNTIKYRSDAHSGPNAKGSCAGGTGHVNDTNCQDFLATPVRSVPLATTSAIMGLSARTWGSGASEKLVLAYATTNLQAWVRHTVSVSLDDLGWAPPPASAAITGLLPDTEIELTNMYVSPSHFPGKTEVLALFSVFNDPTLGGVHSWFYADGPAGDGPSGIWHRQDVLLAGSPMSARRLGGIATWPHQPTPSTPGGACGVFGIPRPAPNNRDQGWIGCYQPWLNDWEFAPSISPSPLADLQLAGRRISVGYHALRESGQSTAPPFGGDTVAGQFWVTAVVSDVEAADDPTKTTPLFLYTRQFSETAWPTAGTLDLVQGDKVWDDWSPTLGHTGVVLRETSEVSALKALFLGKRKNQSDVVVDKLSFLPFADGTWHAELRDTNDFRVMERGICLGLMHKGMEFEGVPCGWKNSSGY